MSHNKEKLNLKNLFKNIQSKSTIDISIIGASYTIVDSSHLYEKYFTKLVTKISKAYHNKNSENNHLIITISKQQNSIQIKLQTSLDIEYIKIFDEILKPSIHIDYDLKAYLLKSRLSEGLLVTIVVPC